MAGGINLATKYSDKVDERFYRESQAMVALNNDYKFTGEKTVKVYSISIVPMNDHARSGGPYTYYWLDKDTPIDDNQDGAINCYDMSWHGRMPRVIPLVDGKDPTTFKVTNVWKRSTETAFQSWKYTLENL